MDKATNLDGAKIYLDRFAQYYFAAISNTFSRTVSSFVRQSYGIGLSEWRVLSNIAQEPNLTAAQISQNNVMDKGLISRSLKSLQAKGLIEVLEHEPGGRNNPARLTDSGIAMHAEIAPFVQAQYSLLMTGISEEEEEALFKILNKLMANLKHLE